MLVNSEELQVSLRSLRILEESLAALHQQLVAANLDLLAATAPTYTQRVMALQAEITNHLHARPSDVSRLPAARPGNGSSEVRPPNRLGAQLLQSDADDGEQERGNIALL